MGISPARRWDKLMSSLRSIVGSTNPLTRKAPGLGGTPAIVEGVTQTKPNALRRLGGRSWALAALLAGIAITAAACSSSPTSSASSSTTSASNAASSGGGALTVSSGMASSVGNVLAGPNGHTLYMLTTEHNGMIKCTGPCTQIWPPLTVSAGETPKLASGLAGTIATVKRPGGTTQVTYNGHPLYSYSSDTAAGQANGQGVDGTWFAETTSGATTTPPTSAPTTSAPTSSTSSGGYSY